MLGKKLSLNQRKKSTHVIHALKQSPHFNWYNPACVRCDSAFPAPLLAWQSSSPNPPW